VFVNKKIKIKYIIKINNFLFAKLAQIEKKDQIKKQMEMDIIIQKKKISSLFFSFAPSNNSTKFLGNKKYNYSF